MTMRQVYQQLARVLARQTGDTMFCRANKVTRTDLKAIQAALLLVLEKIDYDRAHSDFGGAFRLLRGNRPLDEVLPLSPQSVSQNIEQMATVHRNARDEAIYHLFVDNLTIPPDSNA